MKWIVTSIFRGIEAARPNFFSIYKTLLTEQYDALTEENKKKFRLAIIITVAIDGIRAILGPVIIFAIIGYFSFQFYIGNENSELQRFGSIWIIASVIIIAFDVSNFSIFNIRSSLEFPFIPNTISDYAKELWAKWKTIYDRIRRIFEVFTLLFGTFLSGYGDYVTSWLPPENFGY